MSIELKETYGYRAKPSVVKKAIKRAGKEKKKLSTTVAELVEQYSLGNDIAVSDAVKKVCAELRKDKSEGSYYYSWQANIAMSFFDQFINDHEGTLTQRQLSEVCNKAAKRFLDHLIK